MNEVNECIKFLNTDLVNFTHVFINILNQFGLKI